MYISYAIKVTPVKNQFVSFLSVWVHLKDSDTYSEMHFCLVNIKECKFSLATGNKGNRRAHVT